MCLLTKRREKILDEGCRNEDECGTVDIELHREDVRSSDAQLIKQGD